MKTMFQTLNEMNIADGENNTANVGVCDFLIEAKKAKGGGHVTMGVPENVVMDLVFNPDKKSVVLLVIDKAEYEKVKSTPSPVAGKTDAHFDLSYEDVMITIQEMDWDTKDYVDAKALMGKLLVLKNSVK